MDTRGGALSMSTHPGEFLFVLPTDGPLISMDEWLDDWYPNPDIVIREVIREVRNKDAGHTDPVEGPTMEALRTWRGVAGGREVEMKRSLIIGVGDYVAARVRELIDRGEV
jgi:alkanesulfonate monooxygenase SsuD/methylene tetrahydromethanopterin reductase-like flavin-dependent oxidoreductase (luciferase family)